MQGFNSAPTDLGGGWGPDPQVPGGCREPGGGGCGCPPPSAQPPCAGGPALLPLPLLLFLEQHTELAGRETTPAAPPPPRSPPPRTPKKDQSLLKANPALAPPAAAGLGRRGLGQRRGEVFWRSPSIVPGMEGTAPGSRRVWGTQTVTQTAPSPAGGGAEPHRRGRHLCPLFLTEPGCSDRNLGVPPEPPIHLWGGGSGPAPREGRAGIWHGTVGSRAPIGGNRGGRRG